MRLRTRGRVITLSVHPEGSDTTKIAYEIWKSIKRGMDLFISYLICRFFHVIFDFLLDLSIFNVIFDFSRDFVLEFMIFSISLGFPNDFFLDF